MKENICPIDKFDCFYYIMGLCNKDNFIEEIAVKGECFEKCF